MIEGPDIEAHRHRTGHGRTDLILAATAILLSAVSIYIALQHGRTMERLVAANSWPNLSIGTSNEDDAGRDDITFDIQNTGVGPARIDTLELFYRGVAQPDWATLLRTCCGAKKISFETSKVTDEVLPARATVQPLRVKRAAMGDAVWSALNVERFKMDVRVCYCSVFDECYVRDTRARRPVHVPECTLTQPVMFVTY